MLALLHYDWPYNVRELQGCLKRAAALSESSVLDAQHLPETMREAMVGYGTRKPRAQTQAVPAPAASSEPEHARRSAPPSEEQLRELLARHRGNVAAVGRELGKERMQIHRWMQRYGIVVEEYRS